MMLNKKHLKPRNKKPDNKIIYNKTPEKIKKEY